MSMHSYSIALIARWLRDQNGIEWKDCSRHPIDPYCFYTTGIRISLDVPDQQDVELSVQTHPAIAAYAFAETAVLVAGGVIYPTALGYGDDVVRHQTPDDLFQHILRVRDLLQGADMSILKQTMSADDFGTDSTTDSPACSAQPDGFQQDEPPSPPVCLHSRCASPSPSMDGIIALLQHDIDDTEVAEWLDGTTCSDPNALTAINSMTTFQGSPNPTPAASATLLSPPPASLSPDSEGIPAVSPPYMDSLMSALSNLQLPGQVISPHYRHSTGSEAQQAGKASPISCLDQDSSTKTTPRDKVQSSCDVSRRDTNFRMSAIKQRDEAPGAQGRADMDSVDVLHSD